MHENCGREYCFTEEETRILKTLNRTRNLDGYHLEDLLIFS